MPQGSRKIVHVSLRIQLHENVFYRKKLSQFWKKYKKIADMRKGKSVEASAKNGET